MEELIRSTDSRPQEEEYLILNGAEGDMDSQHVATEAHLEKALWRMKLSTTLGTTRGGDMHQEEELQVQTRVGLMWMTRFRSSVSTYQSRRCE